MAMYSKEAEQSVLGGLMLDNRAWERIADLVGEEDFYRQDHRLIFRAVRELVETDRPCDVLTLSETLESRRELDAAGGLAYLAELAKNTPSIANITAYADIVRNRAMRRRFAATLSELQQAIDGPAPIDELLADAQSRLEGIHRRNCRGPTDWSSALVSAACAAESAHERLKAGGVSGIPTGLPALDRRTSGLHGPRLLVIAGRPSLGKSALALQFAVHAAKCGHGVGIISLEMSREELAQRAIAHHYRLNLTKITHGHQAECNRTAEAAFDMSFARLPLYIDDDTYTLGGIVSRIAEWRRQGDISCAIVDHIGLVETERFATRSEQVGAISRMFKKLAKRIDMPILVVSQLNRRVESEKRRPMLADLRDSGSIEQDSDICLFIHCAEPDEEAKIRRVELGLLKNRSGVRGWLPQRFEFDGPTQTFREIVVSIAGADDCR